jgi:hypothetical protein
MPFIEYKSWKPKPHTLAIVDQANEIIDSYLAQGFELTIRQLYYQFVARDLLPNTERSYKNLITTIDRGRQAGYIDWDAIVDRTREKEGNSHWRNPAAIVRGCAKQFQMDMWKLQENRVEVWIEKQALIGVIEDVCEGWDVDYFACRGYNSQSEAWRAGRRFKKYWKNQQRPIVIHLGDHDPSGIDMTYDNQRRLSLFAEGPVDVRRIALKMEQIEEYEPPPNPAKVTDSRFSAYQAEFGDESWELDALDPQTIVGLINDEIESIVDLPKWNEMEAEQVAGRERIAQIANEMEEEDAAD